MLRAAETFNVCDLQYLRGHCIKNGLDYIKDIITWHGFIWKIIVSNHSLLRRLQIQVKSLPCKEKSHISTSSRKATNCSGHALSLMDWQSQKVGGGRGRSGRGCVRAHGMGNLHINAVHTGFGARHAAIKTSFLGTSNVWHIMKHNCPI